MKSTTLLVMMLIGIITCTTTAAKAAAEEIVKKEIIERTTTDKVVKSSVTPGVAKAKPKKPRRMNNKPKPAAKPASTTAPKVLTQDQVDALHKILGDNLNAPFALPTEAPTQVATPAAVTTTADNAGNSKVASGYYLWNGRNQKSEWVTATAKAKSSSNSKFDMSPLLAVFMPDKLTSTANNDHLQILTGIRAFNGTDTSGQNPGWQTSSSDMTGLDGDVAIVAKVWRIAGECRPATHVSKQVTKFMGSTMSGLDIQTSNVIIGKFYVVDNKRWSAYLGYGTEYTDILGSVRMGGYRFKTTGYGWSSVLQAGAEYHLNRWWTLGAAYERSNIRIVTEIPGAPDLVTSRNDRVLFRLGLGLF